MRNFKVAISFLFGLFFFLLLPKNSFAAIDDPGCGGCGIGDVQPVQGGYGYDQGSYWGGYYFQEGYQGSYEAGYGGGQGGYQGGYEGGYYGQGGYQGTYYGQGAYLPTCTVTLTPSPITVELGATATLAATVTCSGGQETDVVFGSSNVAIATATSPDASIPYTSDISGVTVGSATIVVDARYLGASVGTATAIVNVIQPAAWWQVTGADVTSFGNINSPIPKGCSGSCVPYLIKNGTGGFPGVALYGGPPSNYDFSADPANTGNASTENWLSQFNNSSSLRYDYAYTQTLLPASMAFNSGTGNLNNGTVGTGGYIWHKFTGNLTISNPQTITNKVVLFVNGNLTINQRINIPNPGQGFFMAIVSGDIIIDPSLGNVGNNPALEGLYLTDGQIRTGAGNTPITFRGATVAWNGLSLQRDLGDNNVSTPAEAFEFQPSYLLLYPQILTKKPVIWREVAP